MNRQPGDITQCHSENSEQCGDGPTKHTNCALALCKRGVVCSVFVRWPTATNMKAKPSTYQNTPMNVAHAMRECAHRKYIYRSLWCNDYFSLALSRCICPTHRLSFRTHKCSTAERLIVISVVMNRVCSADTTSAPLLGACSEYTSSKSIAQLVFAMCNVQCSL